MNKQTRKWIFRTLFWIIAFINFLASTDLIDRSFDFNYLYYYTELSNFLVFLWVTYIILKGIFKFKGLKHETTMKYIVTVGIMITFLIYNTILGNIFSLGYWRISNVLKHFLLPLFMLFDYIFYTRRKMLKKDDTFRALIFPILYLIYTMVRGIFTHEYPYFFIDPTTIGYMGVLSFVVVLTILGWLFAYLMYSINKTKKR